MSAPDPIVRKEQAVPAGSTQDSGSSQAKAGSGGLRGLDYPKQIDALRVGAASVQMEPAVEGALCTSAELMKRDPRLAVVRTQAAIEIGAVGELVRKYVTAISRWQSEGWNGLLKVSGGNPLVGLTSTEWSGIFMMPFGSAPVLSQDAGMPTSKGGGPAGALAGAAGEQAAGAVVGGIGSHVVGNAINKGSSKALGVLLTAFRGSGIPGFVLGTLIDVVWSVVSDLLGESDVEGRAADAAVDSVMDYRQQIESQIVTGAEGIYSQWDTAKDSANEVVCDSDNAFELEAVLGWLQTNRAALDTPVLDSAALTSQLVGIWFRQHAGDSEEQNKETHEHSYEKTRLAASQPKQLKEKNLFVHQTKYALARLGLDLDGPIDEIELIYQGVQHFGAEQVAAAMSGMELDVSRVSSAAALISGLPAPGLLPHADAIEDLQAAVDEEAFTLNAQLELSEEDGAVVLEGIKFELVPKNGRSMANAPEQSTEDSSQPKGFVWERSWNYSPQ